MTPNTTFEPFGDDDSLAASAGHEKPVTHNDQFFQLNASTLDLMNHLSPTEIKVYLRCLLYAGRPVGRGRHTESIGHVRIGGRPVTVKRMSELVGTGERQVNRALAGLEGMGLLTRRGGSEAVFVVGYDRLWHGAARVVVVDGRTSIVDNRATDDGNVTRDGQECHPRVRADL